MVDEAPAPMPEDGSPPPDDGPPSSAYGPTPATPLSMRLKSLWTTRRRLVVTVGVATFSTIIALNAFIIVKAMAWGGPPTSLKDVREISSATLPIGDAASFLAGAGLPPLAASAPLDGGAMPSDDARPSDSDPKKPQKRKSSRNETVLQAASRTCSTSSVDGLSRQIIAQSRCIDPDAYVPVPSRPNLAKSGHVNLFLDAAARDRLLAVLDASPKRTMTVNSALRTVAQQYLLFRWGANHKCGIQLAANPGESNHETGLALDIAEAPKWRAALEAQGFHWLGEIDRVHFDYAGPTASSRRNIDVMAFQQLWNRNHPDDTIAANGRYSAETEERLKKSPADGFATGPSCQRAPAAAAVASTDDSQRKSTSRKSTPKSKSAAGKSAPAAKNSSSTKKKSKPKTAKAAH
ncbi:MAG: M15 family metallopeptidase [Polyangiaceae bacterium]